MTTARPGAFQPVPAPGFEPSRWSMPPTGEMRLRPQYRNGYIDRFTYTARQLRWSDTGSEWDVAAIARG